MIEFLKLKSVCKWSTYDTQVLNPSTCHQVGKRAQMDLLFQQVNHTNRWRWCRIRTLIHPVPPPSRWSAPIRISDVPEIRSHLSSHWEVLTKLQKFENIWRKFTSNQWNNWRKNETQLEIHDWWWSTWRRKWGLNGNSQSGCCNIRRDIRSDYRLTA